ncbi:ankyrin repeat domain-containing protein [Lacipirellula limnantheis]|uniref:Ankyrin repeats (3 copies) n=1 Tax=Lacipirellula limnantheis TaxID=2528024 RepID=A0A517TSB6_9BACT|nr:ankyrin repeat domain-containing protein [Lacipirellula limnantheis]QDT71263.1 Ankyrin repeats (3 copies) [Lacipirellula limnantheis]
MDDIDEDEEFDESQLEPAGPFDTSMFDAIEANDEAQVRALVAQGAPLNGRYLWGCPILRAVDLGNCGLLRLLGELGADPNGVPTARSPLCSAASQGVWYRPQVDDRQLSVPLIDALLDLGADVNRRQDREGNRNTPLEQALFYYKVGAACRLLERGADPWLKGACNTDAFDFAAGFESPEIFDYLIRYGGPAAKGRIAEARLTAQLTSACFDRDLQKVEALLAQGASPLRADRNHSTPLSIAAGRGREAVVKVLLDHGADPNFFWEVEETPLMKAASDGSREVVDLLLAAGADIYATYLGADNRLYTAVDDARYGGHKELAKYLKSEMKRRQPPDQPATNG